MLLKFFMLLDYSYPIKRSPPYTKTSTALLAAFALLLEAFFQLHLKCRPFLLSFPHYDQVTPLEREK